MDETRNDRKQRAVDLGRRLQDLGVTQDYVAHRIDRSKGYVCRIFNELEVEFVPSAETLRRLEELIAAVAEAMVREILKMGLMTVEIIETCNAPSAHITEASKHRLAQRLVSALASIVAGKPGPVDLPNGIDGVLARIGKEPHCMLVISARSTDPKNDKLTLAHEYEDLSHYFRTKARTLRSSCSLRSDREELPNKMF